MYIAMNIERKTYHYQYCIPQGEKQQLELQVTQLDEQLEQMRTQTAKDEVEMHVLQSRITDFDVSTRVYAG